MTADEAQREIVEALFNVAKHAAPHEFQVFFAGIISNVVGNMSEDCWREFRKIKPCGTVGCDCHLIMPIVMQALEALREDHRNHLSETKTLSA